MSISWSTRITLLYLSFVALIITLIYGSYSKKIELVTPNYYNEELSFQSKIDAQKNMAKLSDTITVSHDLSKIKITFPNDFSNVGIKGKLLFYCPVNSENDFEIPFETNNGAFILPKDKLNTNNYIVKIQWNANEINYYAEEPLNLLN